MRGVSGFPALVSDAMALINEAFQRGVEEGHKQGRLDQSREHHEWLLSHDQRLADIASKARAFALLDAAEAWESAPRGAADMVEAERQYSAGGPSMPTIWLRMRAARQTTTDPEESA